jgi:hypothetical protein
LITFSIRSWRTARPELAEKSFSANFWLSNRSLFLLDPFG